METSVGLVMFGPDSFVEWLKPMIDRVESIENLGVAENLEQLREKVSVTKPRALLVDLDSIGDMSVGAIGVAAKRGYTWVSIVVICSEVSENLLPLYGAMVRRRWSIFGRPLVETIGIERMLAGAFTTTGMQDLRFRELQDEAYEKAQGAGEDVDDDDEDAA